jgi:FAD/FMN-containing dehydrogenase/Fe-S oxidoreductase
MTGSSPFVVLQDRLADSRRHSHPHERFQESGSACDALERRLHATVRGEVRFDSGTRALYATDASNWRQTPIAVVTPLDMDDVIAAVAACRESGAPVLGRGAGTSLAGQTCNVAVVLDYSRHMHRIPALSASARTATVEPGVVLDRLREAAEEHKLTFAPDPATHSRCTLGGMIGNNSCGVHALMGGKTVDNITSLDILLYDGTRMLVGATSEVELASIIAIGGRRGQIYAGLRRLRDRYAQLIRERFPDIPRRVSGYNLDQLLPENGFHVARALVGSEGTCVTILAAECELKESPQFRRLVALGFADAFIAADNVPEILKLKPIGLEGFDSLLLEFMRRKNLAVDDVGLLPDGGGFLLCEFGADSDVQAESQAAALVKLARTLEDSPSARAYTPEEAARVWKVRESALGATVFVPGEESNWEGWEDSAVPPERLGAYLRELYALIERFGYRAPMYGHFGQGCVHLRISFDLKTTEGVARYREFIEEAADIVLQHEGSFSGEHGDGQSRAVLLPKMFGPELMQAFREFKALWDPTNRMNPGKLVDPIAVYDPVENLRIGPGYQAARPETFFTFPHDGGSFGEATERCVGVGACRKEDHGTMCPSYMATREEQHSTRGRAHLLWELMNGKSLEHGFQNEAVHEALDLCLSCKACKTECPVAVDMSIYKAEFLAHRYEHRAHPLAHFGFGFSDRWLRLASVAPRLANASLRLPGAEAVARRLLHLAPQRTLPRLAPSSFRSGVRNDARQRRWSSPTQRSSLGAAATHAELSARKPVLLWADTWNNYMHPESLHAAKRLLEHAGLRVDTPREHVCCGRPLYDFGFLDAAREYLKDILDRFEPQIRAGIPVVMLEPSCASVFREELINFFPASSLAQGLARQTVMLSDMLAGAGWKPESTLGGRKIVVQGHCHQRSVLTMNSDLALLRATGAEVNLLDSGCCGMAGPFGFEAEKFAVSQTLAERVLLPAVRAASDDTLLVANGFSCREQIAQNSPRRAMHLAELLAAHCL